MARTIDGKLKIPGGISLREFLLYEMQKRDGQGLSQPLYPAPKDFILWTPIGDGGEFIPSVFSA